MAKSWFARNAVQGSRESVAEAPFAGSEKYLGKLEVRFFCQCRAIPSPELSFVAETMIAEGGIPVDASCQDATRRSAAACCAAGGERG